MTPGGSIKRRSTRRPDEAVETHSHLSRTTRTSRAAVRNTMLALPAMTRLLQLSPDVRAALRAILLDLAGDARSRADESWHRHKAPLAAYWKAVSVYAGHIARWLR